MKEHGTRIGRSLKVLPCSCLPHMVLEQSTSLLISQGFPARLLQVLYSLSPLPAHIQPCKDTGPSGSLARVVSSQEWRGNEIL